ncbi:trigger factor [Bifidobacterium gallicum]|uniref:Trigger factor n=1 Tax=Bifidobacterium gallicum DSM 20093 = LMG 11596 TaxID=561180 RepID=D1NRY5_9BIFI|nr:trigger factor [Bifidobacterium gallicum]EFA23437.1 trigger factor [Bifidobacterium gallicum DSM 20093 = LMG 11596]KFI57270.1 trigger factor [Bifidobacterium gallicum DSM 20093 = LMG 11596]
MKISVRNLEPTKAKLTITVDNEEFEPYLQEAREEIAKQINVPGFRKGHVPAKIVDQRVGFGAVAGEAINKAVPEFYSQALETKEIRPMAQPEIEVTEVPESADSDVKLKFTATVERRPQFDLPELDEMTIEVEPVEVEDADVDKRLEALRQRFGTLVGVDRPAQEGDYVNIDLDAQIDGESVDTQEGVSYEIGSGTMLDGIDEALEGLSADEETTFESTLTGGDHAGEKATVKVKVNSVKTEELPELDDDFAQEASEFDTLDELKEEIRKAAAMDAKGRQATAARDAFIAKIEEGLEIPVPKGVLEQTVEEQLKSQPNADDETKKQVEEDAEKALRDQMVLDALAEKLDVEVSQSDVFNFLASIAQQYGMDPNQFIQAILSNGQIGSAVQEVARSKGMLGGMRKVTFTSNGETLDLSDFLGSDDEADAEVAAVEEDETVAAAAAAAAVADDLAKDAE